MLFKIICVSQKKVYNLLVIYSFKWIPLSLYWAEMTKVDLCLASEVIVKNNKRIAWMSYESSICSETVNKPNQRLGVDDLLKAKVTLPGSIFSASCWRQSKCTRGLNKHWFKTNYLHRRWMIKERLTVKYQIFRGDLLHYGWKRHSYAPFYV